MAANGRSRGRAGADAVVLASLAGGATAAEAAISAHVSERTVRRRCANPEFLERLDEARGNLLRLTMDRLSGSATSAIATLNSLMQEDTAPSVRLGAAKAVLELGSRLRSELELSERLAAIEDHLDSRRLA